MRKCIVEWFEDHDGTPRWRCGEYLMSRGLSQGEAQAAIVRGFLDTSIMGLPGALKKEIDEAITACEKEVF